MIKQRLFGMSEALESLVAPHLENVRWPTVAKTVLEMSDTFSSPGQATPWHLPEAIPAYLSYFLPLNSARLQAVFSTLQALNISLPKHVIDFGSGVGTAQLNWVSDYLKWQNIELASDPINLHRELLESLDADKLTQTQWTKTAPHSILDNSLVMASYALTELEDVPAWFYQAHTLLLIEPSTMPNARRLMSFRQNLLDKGFHAIAPCTHQQSCPLLVHSQKDWCHDRFFFKAPSWWSRLSAHLPMRNDSVTMSYLVMSRAPLEQPQGIARVIGDTLYEKGKTRQAVCRGPAREFLAWLKKSGEPQEIPHGYRVLLNDDIELKANELRPNGLLKTLP